MSFKFSVQPYQPVEGALDFLSEEPSGPLDVNSIWFNIGGAGNGNQSGLAVLADSFLRWNGSSYVPYMPMEGGVISDPSAPVEYTWTSSGLVFKWQPVQTIVQTLAGGIGVVGTTDISGEDVINQNLSIPTGGTYKITLLAWAIKNNNIRDVIVTFEIGSDPAIDTPSNEIEVIRFEPKDSQGNKFGTNSQQMRPYAPFFFKDLSKGSTNFLVRVLSEDSNGLASVHNAKILVERIS